VVTVEEILKTSSTLLNAQPNQKLIMGMFKGILL
jgi:hypothetical protein